MICFDIPPLWVDLSFGLPQLRMVFCFAERKTFRFLTRWVFSRWTLFCLASEAFIIFSSAVADGFSIFDFRFSPDSSVFFYCFCILSWNLLSCQFSPLWKDSNFRLLI